jgi:hypothetical protein
MRDLALDGDSVFTCVKYHFSILYVSIFFFLPISPTKRIVFKYLGQAIPETRDHHSPAPVGIRLAGAARGRSMTRLSRRSSLGSRAGGSAPEEEALPVSLSPLSPFAAARATSPWA